VGTPVKVIEELLLGGKYDEQRNALAAETPRWEAEVDDFYLMPTEVTNEQFAAFVEATGAKPPLGWAHSLVANAQKAHIERESRRKAEAQLAGVPFEFVLFDAVSWWDEHWSEHSKAVRAAQEDLARPVVNVSHADALAYCRWAGLRLMTEVEFQCAGRGSSERIYPWGNTWDDKQHARTLHSAVDKTAPVGSYASGAVGGLYDLTGNVWEWTSSPYTLFPGYKPLRVERREGNRKRVMEVLADPDKNLRVAVGGSFANDRIAARLTTRFGAEPSQATDALGFRCAASLTPGEDVAELVLASAAQDKAQRDLRFDAPGAAILQRWVAEPGAARQVADPAAGTRAIAGYAVITDYDRVMFVSVDRLPFGSLRDLTEASTAHGPLHLGVLATSVAFQEPALEPGTYHLLWRGAGELVPPRDASRIEGDGARAHAARSLSPSELQRLEATPGFASDRDTLILADLDGNPIVAMPSPPIGFERVTANELRHEPYVPPADPTAHVEPLDTLHLSLYVESTIGKKGFTLDLELELAPGAIDASWR
jgi:formylglycine-generating enzyme required for sulfatase activity